MLTEIHTVPSDQSHSIRLVTQYIPIDQFGTVVMLYEFCIIPRGIVSGEGSILTLLLP